MFQKWIRNLSIPMKLKYLARKEKNKTMILKESSSDFTFWVTLRGFLEKTTWVYELN